jgi:hypothetical protein
LPTPTKAALEAWLQARGTDEGPLFVNFDRAGKGGRLTGSAVYFTSVSSGRRLGSPSVRTGFAILPSPPPSIREEGGRSTRRAGTPGY